LLNDRTQSVVINGNQSKWEKVTSGVPQGTVLGPLLFLVYINDLPLHVNSNIKLFADDSYLYRTIKSLEDTLILQRDLDALSKWEIDWSMEFHPEKCKFLRITNKNKPVVSEYQIHGKTLELVDSAKYLGVNIHKKLSWKPHVNSICHKANQKRAFLQRNLRGCNKSIKAKCYDIYIKPIIMYASPVWNPVGNR